MFHKLKLLGEMKKIGKNDHKPKKVTYVSLQVPFEQSVIVQIKYTEIYLELFVLYASRGNCFL